MRLERENIMKPTLMKEKKKLRASMEEIIEYSNYSMILFMTLSNINDGYHYLSVL